MRYGTHFLLSFILAWFCNKELIAGYETALLLSTLVSFFFISSLNQAMVSYFKKNDQTKKLIWSAFVVLVLMTGVSVVLFVLYLFFFSNAEEQKKMIRFLPFLFFNMLGYFVEFYLYISSQKKKMLLYGMLTFLFYFSLVLFGMGLRQNLVLTFSLLTCLAICKCTYMFLILPKPIRIYKDHFFAIIKTTLPITASLLLGGSLLHILGLYVKQSFSSDDFVIFRYGSREFPLILILANSFSIAYTGILSKNLAVHKGDFIRSYKRLLWQCFTIAILLMLSSKFLFFTFYGESFTEAAKIFNIFLLFILSRLLFPQTFLLATNNQNYFYISSSLELFFGLLFGFWLGNIYGIVGIAYGALIAYFIEKFVLLYFLSKTGVSYQKWMPIGHYLIGAFLLGICYLTSLFVL